MAYQLSEINRQVSEDPKGFLRQCDEEYQNKVERAADAIAENMLYSPLVLLAGPSSSGKTTTAMKIAAELNRRGISTHTISMDNYFLTLTPEQAPHTETGEVDYESPLYMDMELLNDHFTRLARGEEVVIPKFEFAKQQRNEERGIPLRLKPREVAIFEGIHALSDGVADQHPQAATVYISAQSDVMDGDNLLFRGRWMRLTRRCVRDYNFRGTTVPETLVMWNSVRRGEKLYIAPFKKRAKVSFDSSLPYEVPVMRVCAMPLLDAVPPENPQWENLKAVRRAFEAFSPLDPNLLHPDSLLREFIGGGSYVY